MALRYEETGYKRFNWEETWVPLAPLSAIIKVHLNDEIPPDSVPLPGNTIGANEEFTIRIPATGDFFDSKLNRLPNNALVTVVYPMGGIYPVGTLTPADVSAMESVGEKKTKDIAIPGKEYGIDEEFTIRIPATGDFFDSKLNRLPNDSLVSVVYPSGGTFPTGILTPGDVSAMESVGGIISASTETRLTTIEAENNVQTTRLDNLEPRIANAESINTAQTTRLDNLEPRVSALDQYPQVYDIQTTVPILTTGSGKVSEPYFSAGEWKYIDENGVEQLLNADTVQNTDIADLQTRVTTLESASSPTITEVRVSSIEGVNTAQNTRLDNLEPRVTAVENTDTNQNADITALQNRATNIEGVNTAQGTTIGDHETRISALEGATGSTVTEARVAAIEAVDTAQATDIGDLQTRVTAVETKDTSQDASINDHETRITNLEPRLTTVENVNTAQNTRLDNLEPRVSALETVDAGHRTELDNLHAGFAYNDGRLTNLESKFPGGYVVVLQTGNIPNTNEANIPLNIPAGTEYFSHDLKVSTSIGYVGSQKTIDADGDTSFAFRFEERIEGGTNLILQEIGDSIKNSAYVIRLEVIASNTMP